MQVSISFGASWLFERENNDIRKCSPSPKWPLDKKKKILMCRCAVCYTYSRSTTKRKNINSKIYRNRERAERERVKCVGGGIYHTTITKSMGQHENHVKRKEIQINILRLKEIVLFPSFYIAISSRHLNMIRWNSLLMFRFLRPISRPQ